MAFVESNPSTIHTHTGSKSTVTQPNTATESVTYSADQAGDAVFGTAQLSNGSDVVLSATAYKETPALQSYSEGGYQSFQLSLINSSGAISTTTLSFTGGVDLTGKYPYATDLQMVALTNGGFVLTEELTNDGSYDGSVNSNLYYEVLDNNANVIKSWTQVNTASGSVSNDTSTNGFYDLQAESSGGFDIKYLTDDEKYTFLKRYSAAGVQASSTQVTETAINGFIATATDTAGDVMFTFSSLSTATPDYFQVLNGSNTVIAANQSLGTGGPSSLPLHSFGIVGLATGGFLQLLYTVAANGNANSYNVYARTATVSGSSLSYTNLALIAASTAVSPSAKTTALSNGDVAISLNGGAYELLRPSALPTNSTTVATLPPIFGTLSPGSAMLATNTAERTATFASAGPDSSSGLISAQESPIAADHNGGLIAALQTGTTTEYYGVVDANLYVADFSQPPPTLTLSVNTAEPVQGGAAVAVLSGQPGVANATGATGATVSITNGQSGDTLSLLGITGMTGTLDSGKIAVTGNGTTALTLSGADTLAEYQLLLSQVALYYGSTDSITGSHPTRQVSFAISSGGIQSSASTVTLTLDRTPVVAGVAATVAAGATRSVIAASTGVLPVDSDIDGDSLSVTGVATSSGTNGTVGSSLAGKYGSLTLKADGTYSYTANASIPAPAGSHPADGFTDQVSDGKGGLATTTLTFNIERAPGAVTDSNATANSVAEGSASGTTTGITAQSVDPDSDAVSYAITGDSSNGGFAINANTGVITVASGAKLDYASAASHSYTVTVQASDGTLTSSQAFAIAVADVAPTISGSSGGQTIPNGATVAPFAHVVIGEAGSAIQVEALTVKQTQVANGVFTAASLMAAGFTADATTAGQYDFSGTATQDTTAIDQLVYQPVPAPGGVMLTTNFTIGVGDGTLSASDATTSVTVPCFARGTRIRTIAGDVPVEQLVAGDVVVTARGEQRPIRWIGTRSFSGRFLATAPQVQPIRFRAGCLGDGLPQRDLLISPDHAMLLDGVLVPARELTNGRTIVRERGLERVDYFHVELDDHDIVLAEGAPSESYLDGDNGGMFHNTREASAWNGGSRLGYCARRVDVGVELEAIRQRLAGLFAAADRITA